MVCLVFFSAFFSASETAFFYLSRAQVRSFAAGTPRQRVVAALMSTPERLLSAVLFWNLLINLLYFAVSVTVVHRLSAGAFQVTAGAFGIGSLLFMIMFGEVCPKSIAVVFRGQLAPLVAWPLAAAVRVLDPVLPMLEKVARVVRRGFWPGLVPEPVLRPEDLEQAVDASGESAAVRVAEKQVLLNVLELSEVTAEELMRPRGMYAILTLPLDSEQLRAVKPRTDFAVVVAAGSDDVIGSLALDSVSGPLPQDCSALVEDVFHVPWCATVASVLQTMRERYLNVAVVVDEYGSTMGIVTYHDVVDAILLPQPGRTQRLLRREPVVQVAEGKFEVEGLTTLRYLSRRLGLDHDPVSDASLTVAGLLHDELEELPREGQSCRWKGWVVRVLEASDRGVRTALLERDQPEGTQP